ncbi:MAG TPA: JAB domain-containing protein [Gammaproteobacteria bacterium]
MEKKTVNIINFENIETVYRKEKVNGAFRVLEFIAKMPKVELETITRPHDLKDLLDKIFATLEEDQEHLVLLILNAANEVRGYKVIASGGQNYVDMDPRVIFRNALLLGAANLILVHNHPTGKPTPSAHDLEVTKRVAEAGRILNVELLDHVIWTGEEVSSIREHAPDCFKS